MPKPTISPNSPVYINDGGKSRSAAKYNQEEAWLDDARNQLTAMLPSVQPILYKMATLSTAEKRDFKKANDNIIAPYSKLRKEYQERRTM
jgi:hypothetical protein